MSRRFYAVLARLSYIFYLVFPVVATQFAGGMADPSYLTYMEMIYKIFYNIVVTNLVAMALYVLFERPFAHCLDFLRIHIQGPELILARDNKLSRSINEDEEEDITPGRRQEKGPVMVENPYAANPNPSFVPPYGH